MAEAVVGSSVFLDIYNKSHTCEGYMTLLWHSLTISSVKVNYDSLAGISDVWQLEVLPHSPVYHRISIVRTDL